jgi:hypothetical protein
MSILKLFLSNSIVHQLVNKKTDVIKMHSMYVETSTKSLQILNEFFEC